jgi:signal transduction histidine kinase/ActR/RegA family two-component response regulator
VGVSEQTKIREATVLNDPVKALLPGVKKVWLNVVMGGLGEHTNIELARKIIVVNVFAMTGVLALITLGTLARIQDNLLLSWLDYIAAMSLVVAILYFRQTKNFKVTSYFGIALIMLLFYYLLFTGGVNNSAHVWYFTFPLIATFILGATEGLIATIILFIPALMFFGIKDPPGMFATYSMDFKLRFIPSFVVIAAFAYLFESTRERAQAKLESVNAELNITVSVLKETDDKLRKAGEEMERRVIERTEQLYMAIMQLETEMAERKRSEDALRDSEGKLNAILYSISDYMVMVDRDLNILWSNEKAREAFNIGCDGGKCYEALCGRDRPCGTEPCYAVQAFQDGDIHEDEAILINRNGQVLDCHCVANVALRDGEDKPTAVLKVLRDITEKKQTDREKKSLEERLRRSEKMEAIGTLAGGVAHDLNNILGAIVGYPELILMDLPEGSPLRKGISAIQKSGEKAAAIVQDMLTLARRGVAVMEPVNFNDIIRDYLRSPELEKLRSFHPDIRIDGHLDDELLPMLGSPVHLSKIVMNLVSNAAEAMPRGGLIKIETTNRYVDTSIQGYDHVSEGEYIVIKITDTGIGIAPKDISKIFEPFYTKKVMGRSGTGLGMAVVWGTVKDHNGYIDIQSEEGRGTTITIYFPVNRQAAGKEEKKIYIENFMARGETILVVDDVAEQREIAYVMLKKLGYNINAMSSGEEAVEYLGHHSADLVILDMIMDPGIDGLETYKKITEQHPEQKAIIVSGFAETERVKEAQRLGAGQYIKKPYTLERIAVAVRTELDSGVRQPVKAA